MDIVHERAAGLDISKRDAMVCRRVPGQRAGAFTSAEADVPDRPRLDGRLQDCNSFHLALGR